MRPDGGRIASAVRRSLLIDFDDDEFAMTLVRDQLGQWVYPVHRLDRGASGVLLFGLSSEAARVLCTQFENHTRNFRRSENSC